MVRPHDSHRVQSAARYAIPLRQEGAELAPAKQVDFRHAQLRLGIDVGSTTVKLAVIDANDNLVYANYERHHTDVRATARSLFTKARRIFGDAPMRVSITGSGGMLLAKWLDLEFVQEVIACATHNNALALGIEDTGDILPGYQADIVAVSPVGVHIFKLKVGESADEALKQVKEKHYDAPYRGRGLPIWLIGLNFDRQTRHLMDAKAVQVS